MTNIKTIAKKHGFTVTRARQSDSLGGTFIEMSHEKSGASLCFTKNGEDNKLFCIGFKQRG